jgi:FkbM family methyltransferase
MNIVQVGCNHGDDHVFHYIKSNKNAIKNAYLIEPMKSALNMAVNHYSGFENVHFFNIAITEDPNKKELELFMPANEVRCEATSVKREHVVMHVKHQDIISFTVPAMTINDFFDSQNLKIIDRLYIDTEGLDCDIVNTIDLDKYDIKRIQFEHIHAEFSLSFGNSILYNNILSKLTKAGYTLTTSGFDTIAEIS